MPIGRLSSATICLEECGSSLVESSLSLSLFLLVVLGMADLSRMVYAFEFVTHSAHDAARYACVRGTSNAASSSDITAFVKNEASLAIDPFKISVTSIWNPDHTAGSSLSVAVTYTFTPLFMFIASQPFTFRGTSKMTIAQ